MCTTIRWWWRRQTSSTTTNDNDNGLREHQWSVVSEWMNASRKQRHGSVCVVRDFWDEIGNMFNVLSRLASCANDLVAWHSVPCELCVCVDCWMGINRKCERSRMTRQTYGTISLGTRSSFETNEERRKKKWKETERHGRGSRKYFSWIFMIKVYYYCRRSYEANGIPNIRWCHMELNARQMVNVLPTIGPRVRGCVRVSGVRKYKKR